MGSRISFCAPQRLWANERGFFGWDAEIRATIKMNLKTSNIGVSGRNDNERQTWFALLVNRVFTHRLRMLFMYISI